MWKISEEMWDQMSDDRERLLDEVKRLRAIVEKLPKTADGVPIVPGMEVFFICPDPGWWNLDPDTIVSEKVDSIVQGNGFPDHYKGEFTICGDDRVELGNLDCYSTREAAEAAKAEPIPARDQEHDGHDGHL